MIKFSTYTHDAGNQSIYLDPAAIESVTPGYSTAFVPLGYPRPKVTVIRMTSGQQHEVTETPDMVYERIQGATT